MRVWKEEEEEERFWGKRERDGVYLKRLGRMAWMTNELSNQTGGMKADKQRPCQPFPDYPERVTIMYHLELSLGVSSSHNSKKKGSVTGRLDYVHRPADCLFGQRLSCIWPAEQGLVCCYLCQSWPNDSNARLACSSLPMVPLHHRILSQALLLYG